MGARYQVYKLLSKNYSKIYSKNYSIFFFKLGSGEQGIKFTNYYQKSTVVYICFFDKEDVQTRTYDQWMCIQNLKHDIFIIGEIFSSYSKVYCKEVGFISSHSIKCWSMCIETTKCKCHKRENRRKICFLWNFLWPKWIGI